MTDSTSITIGYDDGDNDTNRSLGGDSLNTLIERRYSRRSALLGGTKAAALAVFGGSVLAACGKTDAASTPTPVVTAGSSGATTSGRIVTLTGSATNGAAVTSTAFTQASGPTVALTQTAAGTTFMAPSVSAATTLVFRYASTDASRLTVTADTSVVVSPAALGFAAVSKNKLDVVTVPAGYTVSILYRLGDPIDAGTAAYKNDGTDTGFSSRAGDHSDALYWFGLAAAGSVRDDNSSTRGLLVMNHENINQPYLHVAGATTVAGARPEAEALKEMECHGLSVIEVTSSTAGAWSYVQSGALNRRITPLTPMVFNGPVKGSDLLKTVFSPTGVAGRGTINNCANGHTPWGTDLTCEENWAGYFRRPAADNALRTAKEVTSLNRSGVTSSTGSYNWSTVVAADTTSTIYRRWNAQVTGATATDDFRNEPYQFGWVVEIDPYDKTTAPRKRTALGRFNHEGCWPSNFVVGRKPAFYMGDDAQNEYLYKFVSATPWAAADASAIDRLSIGDKYMDSGTLYVAKFNADGSGGWSPLTFGSGSLTAGNAVYPFADQADVLANARLAGDALGATKMDRPEWTAVNPVSGEMYLTLTNNASRTPANTDAANPRAYLDPPSTAVANRNGHIIRLRETGDTSEALAFAWDIYAFGAGSDLDATNINLSGLDATNDFSSPDGLWFGRSSNASGLVTPVLWIQTDDSAYTDVTNCMMLAAMPGAVNDGTVKTITNTPTGGTGATQATRVGKAPGTALRRFLVGPLEAEITGVDSTPDGRTLFVNIQHPGENGSPSKITSHWPDTQASGTAAASIRPRSATVVITKNDGGVVAL